MLRAVTRAVLHSVSDGEAIDEIRAITQMNRSDPGYEPFQLRALEAMPVCLGFETIFGQAEACIGTFAS